MKKLNKKELLNLHGKEYVNSYHSEDSVRIKRLFEFIDLKETDRVLDVGCGNGLLLDYLFNKVKEYNGVDFSKDFIQSAKKRNLKRLSSKVKFLCGDVIVFCKRSKVKFDKAFALDFVEHIYDDDLVRIFSSVFKSLRKGGELYIHTPNAKYLLEIFKAKGIMRQFPEHIAVRDFNSYDKLFRKAGFRKIEVVYLPHYLKILSIFDFLRYIPFIGAYFKARLFVKCIK